MTSRRCNALASQRKIKSIPLVLFPCYCKKTNRRQFSLVCTLIGHKTGNNQRLGSAFDDLDSRLYLLCYVGDDVIRPCKICGRGGVGGGGGSNTRTKIYSFKAINVNVSFPIQSRLQSV